MLLFLFLVFLVMPVVEIAVFIQVGGLIGAPATVAFVLLNAILGASLLRAQGLSTLRRADESLKRGELPVDAVLDGVGLMVAGALLITPGLVTDLIGFLLLIPPLRRVVAMEVFQRLIRFSIMHVQVYGEAQHPEGPSAGQGGPVGRRGERPKRGNSSVIDAEYEMVDEPSRPQPGKKSS